MFRKFKFRALVLAGALALLSPAAALAERHERGHEHHHHRWGVYFAYGPRYYHAPYYANGYYDRWGYWHPYRHGYYDRWGRRHRAYW